MSESFNQAVNLLAEPVAIGSPMLTLVELSLKYADKLAIKQLSLTLRRGESIAILGRSGAGKSTLLAHIHQQLQSQAAYCSQQQGLVDALSSYHNVYMGGLARHHWLYNLANLISPFSRPLQEVERLCRTLELDFPLSNTVAKLSGGQRQRVALARALYQQQPVFIGDEPFSALDAQMTKRLIARVFADHDTVIMALHDNALAVAHFDRIIGLEAGELTLDISRSQYNDEQRHRLIDNFYGHTGANARAITAVEHRPLDRNFGG